MNDVELIYEAYEQVIAESRPFKLPAGLDKLVDSIFYQVKRHYEDAASDLRQHITPEEFYKKEDGKLILIYRDQHDIKSFLKEFNIKQKEIEVCVYLASAEKVVNSGGNADTTSNIINIFLPLYDIDLGHLRKTIIHEIAHLYDPHLLYSRALFSLDKGLGQSANFNYTSNVDNLSGYYTGTGYRAGKIPLEFNPKVVEIISTHSRSEIEIFINTLDVSLLDRSFHNFVKEMLNHKYLKRKLLEKLYNYVYVYKADEQLEIFHGAICVYDDLLGELVTQRIKPGITELWNNPNIVALHAELEMDAVYREFNNHDEFKAAVRQYLIQHKHNAAVSAIKLFDPLERAPGIYKLIAQEDHGILMFGKEIY